ncbi:hypothetical protein [Parvimonas micra]|uniref:hypothetical protein n=1 Tax=Parvimonas micra TaxID=33033 RepID=UPI0022B6D1E4|nr:hypothetical protein [Parvimonas micra]MCZ7408736.1 hypothetical protein [Parvimonas micra]
MSNLKEKNMFESNKIIFTLKQITPIIHFKGEKDTLRGTDLKPRFDKFLNLVIDEKEKKGLLLKKSKDNNEQTDAFDYKIKIIKGKPDNTEQYLKNGKIIGAYFGDLGKSSKDSDKPAYELSFYKSIDVEFIVNNDRLKAEIKKWFPKFMIFNTFGTRKNKGYGYFLPEKCDNTTIRITNLESIIEEIRDKYCYKGKSYLGVYKIEFSEEKKKYNSKVFNQLNLIKDFHQILKSGTNFNNVYKKSIMLKQYKYPENSCNEKKGMKIILNSQGINIDVLLNKSGQSKKDFPKKLPKNVYYVRGMLGFSSFYEFRYKFRYEFRKIKNGKFTLKSEVGENIERFESPIQYIPIPNEKAVLLLVNYKKIEDFRTNREFNFTNNQNNKNKKYIFKVPNEDEYSIHNIFKEDGVIYSKKDEYKDYFNYSVVKDIEEYPYGVGEKEEKNVK